MRYKGVQINIHNTGDGFSREVNSYDVIDKKLGRRIDNTMQRSAKLLSKSKRRGTRR